MTREDDVGEGRRTPRARELHPVGATRDGWVLLSERPGGPATHRVAAGERLEQLAGQRAPRPQRRALVTRGEVGAAQVQARLRAGLSAEEVVRQTGLDAAWVEQLAHPVRAEMAAVTAAARASVVTGDGEVSDRTLEELLRRQLPARADEDAVDWAATKRRDGAWRVTARVRAGRTVQTATWVWEPRARRLRAASARARAISFPTGG